MELDTILALLKDEHQIDVADLQNKAVTVAEEMKSQLTDAMKQVADAVTVKEAAVAELNAVKMQVVLDNLISEGKATQETNKLNSLAFNAMGYAQAVEFAKAMPVLFPMEPTAMTTSNEQPEVKPLTRSEQVKAYMVAHNMEDTSENYLVASTKI